MARRDQTKSVASTRPSHCNYRALGKGSIASEPVFLRDRLRSLWHFLELGRCRLCLRANAPKYVWAGLEHPVQPLCCPATSTSCRHEFREPGRRVLQKRAVSGNLSRRDSPVALLAEYATQASRVYCGIASWLHHFVSLPDPGGRPDPNLPPQQ